MSLVEDLITISKYKFKYKEPERLKEYFEKAIKENRLLYLYKNNKTIGYLIYFLFDKQGLDEYLKKGISFDFPEHNPKNKYLYIEECVIFNGYKANLTYLRKLLRKLYPHIEYVCWYRLRKERRKLFMIKYDGGNI